MTATGGAAQSMGARHWAVLLLTAVLFGSSFFFIKTAIAEVPPATLAAARALLAVPVAWALLRLAGGRLPPPGGAWWPLLVLGVLTAAVPYAAIAWGQRHIESGLAGILFGTIPVFSVVVAPLLLAEERHSGGRLAGAAVGLAGVVLIIGPQALAGIDRQFLGAGVTLIAALSYALGGIYSRRQAGIPPTAMAVGQLLTASMILVPVALVVDAPWRLAPSAAAVGAVAAVAVASTALPAFLLFWLIRNAGATNASLMTFFMPVVAVVLGAALLGERLPWPAFAGLALILLGAAAVGGRLPGPAGRRRLRRA